LQIFETEISKIVQGAFDG